MTYIPGTVTPIAGIDGNVFGIFSQMIRATNGLTLAQICSITGLEPSTIQNWVKRGYVANPIKKRYYDRQLARILLINALRDCLQIEQIIAILKYLNGDVEDQRDDALSEAQLFDYFCQITQTISVEHGISRETIGQAIGQATKGFTGYHEDSPQKLRKVLEIICYAYTAARYKKEAEFYIGLL